MFHVEQTAAEAKKALAAFADPVRASNSNWFFKTGPGEYGEGDIFIGATVPQVRSVGKAFKDLPLDQLEELAQSPIHEERLMAAHIMAGRFAKLKPTLANSALRQELFDFYLRLGLEQRWNNWDLIDTSAPYFGCWLVENPNPDLLEDLANSESLWDRRMAVMFTFAHIRAGIFEPTLRIARILHNDKQDLIHKAVGWMLREVGNRNIEALRVYLEEMGATMARTQLRYAIEKLEPAERAHFMGLAKVARNR
jgi:3-methyladenine DNA glycosylase AlkD